MGESIVDSEGFVKDPTLWTEDVAREIAKNRFNMDLTDLHMEIIRFVREYYLKWGSMPMVKTIRNKANLTDEQLTNLFKHSAGRGTIRGVICRISGLPKMLCIAAGC